VSWTHDDNIRAYNFSSSLDSLTFLDQSIRTKKHDTDLASFQVHAHALDTGSEPTIQRQLEVVCEGEAMADSLDQFFGLDIIHAMDAGNTVTGNTSSALCPSLRWI